MDRPGPIDVVGGQHSPGPACSAAAPGAGAPAGARAGSTGARTGDDAGAKHGVGGGQSVGTKHGVEPKQGVGGIDVDAAAILSGAGLAAALFGEPDEVLDLTDLQDF